jgi:hypothetical protein
MFVAEREGCHGPEYHKDADYVARAIALDVFF